MAENNPHPEELRNPDVRHEPGDINAKALTKFGLSMSALIVVFCFGLWGMFEFLKNREAQLGMPASPSALVNSQKQPPEPRLQRYPTQDMQTWRAAESQAMHRYAWVDPDKGIVQIPVDRAMDLLVERGLPPTRAPAAGKTK